MHASCFTAVLFKISSASRFLFLLSTVHSIGFKFSSFPFPIYVCLSESLWKFKILLTYLGLCVLIFNSWCCYSCFSTISRRIWRTFSSASYAFSILVSWNTVLNTNSDSSCLDIFSICHLWSSKRFLCLISLPSSLWIIHNIFFFFFTFTAWSFWRCSSLLIFSW